MKKQKRGIVCCFCGEAWGYEGDKPTDALLKQAVDHEAKCPKNPYLAKIATLRAALEIVADCDRNGWPPDHRQMRAIRQAIDNSQLQKPVGRKGTR